MSLIGRAYSGRGQAEIHLKAASSDIERLTGELMHPGSLNVILSSPARLRPDCALIFGDKAQRRLWRAELGGHRIWLYRWKRCPLHVVEVLAEVHLRAALAIADKDRLMLHTDQRNVDPIGTWERLRWSLLWSGRKASYYRNDDYQRWVARHERKWHLHQW